MGLPGRGAVMIRRPRRWAAAYVALAAVCIALAAPAGAAETADPFYAGKTIRVMVGFGPGGGYDLYARTLARFLGQHIAGGPAIIVQNMPGAGSLKVVNYLFNAAPRDGTALATFARGVVYEPLLGHPEGAQFEAPKFNWIGSIANEVSVCAFNAPRGIATWQDMTTKTTLIGASGTGADSDVFPTVLRNLFALPMRIVTGYPGGAELVLAMERGEIDGRCGWSWTSLLARNRDMLAGKRITVPLQIALQRHEDLADIPTIMELPGDLRREAALKLIVSRQAIARPFAAPPGVAPERIEALRNAFDATMRDPDFLAEMRSLGLEVRPVGGAAVQNLMREIHASSPDVLKLARELLVETPPAPPATSGTERR
jgi:tripartite-type tricarboxylate transporter receptor subunit TctC